jgi:GNAT superfamily N-acetyltransferase
MATRCVRDRTPADFAVHAWDLIAADPIRNNVICTLVEAACLDGRSDWEWLRVLDEDELVGVAIRTPPRGPLLSDLDESGAHAVAAYLARTPEKISSVNGPPAAAHAFAQRYAALRGGQPRLGSSQRLLWLDQVIWPAAVPGHSRPAEPAERDLVLAWMVAFARDAGTAEGAADHADAVDLRFEHGDLMWFWEVDGVPVSFAWRSPIGPPRQWPRTPVTRISAVYTPHERRGHGYASANVAALSQRGLDAGAHACMLYADAANPISNKIYERIGYRLAGEGEEWRIS